MTRTESDPQKIEHLEKIFSSMREDVENFCRLDRFDSEDQYYDTAIRASFSKLYALCRNAHAKSDIPATFLFSNLRAICEELIFLAAIGKFDPADCNRICAISALIDTHNNLETQKNFFLEYRPYQPVFQGFDIDIRILKNENKATWRKYGFKFSDNLNKPRTRLLAEHLSDSAVPLLYDFLFKMTSSGVHFNMPTLMKMGWGEKSSDGAILNTKINLDRMNNYYDLALKVYSGVLFCLYIEYFDDISGSVASATASLSKIRDILDSVFRWPELVTFEEMNLDVKRNFILEATMKVALKDQVAEGFRNIKGLKDFDFS